MNKEIDLEKAKELGSLEIKDAVFFIPEDFKKFEGTGKWVLHIKEGKIVRVEK